MIYSLIVCCISVFDDDPDTITARQFRDELSKKMSVHSTGNRFSPLPSNLYVAVAYAFAGWLAHLLAPETGFASLVWLPAGLALGLLLAFGQRLLLGIWLGASCINAYFQFAAGHGTALSLVSGSLMGCGAALQGWLAYRLVHGIGGMPPSLDSVSGVMRFLGLGAVLASTVSATVGSSVLAFLPGDSATPWLATWFAWWVGDALGATLVTPIVLALCARSDDGTGIWRKRRLSLALPLAAALVVLSASFIAVGRFENDNRRAEFERHAARQAVLLNTEMQTMLEIPVVLRDYFKISGSFRREDFEAFAARMYARHPALRALLWLPTQSDGKALTVDFMFPLANNAGLRGVDFAAQPDLHSALVSAEETRQPAVSAGVTLPGEDVASRQTVMIFVPVFWAPPGQAEEVLRGYVAAATEIGEVARRVLPDLEQDGLLLRVSDLAEQGAAASLFTSLGFERYRAFRHGTTLEFGNRRLHLEFAALPDSLLIRRASTAWPVYFGGLFFSLLLTAFLLLISANSVRAEHLVSERTREVERARRDAEKANKLFHEAVGSIAQGFTIYDENDRLVVCNEAYLKMYETSRDLIVPGATFEEIVRRGAERGQYADAVGRVDEWVAQRVAQHRAATGAVIEQQLGDGRWLMIVEYRTPSGYIAGNRIDITPIKQAAAQIEDRNAQLDALFRLSPDGFVAIDRSGLVKFANPAFYEITGISAEEIIGKGQTLLEKALLARAEKTAFQFALESVFEDGGQANVLNLIRPEWRSLQIVGVVSQSSEISRILYLRDVTHEVEVSRMKSEFLSHAAHELRTPMTSILGFSELMLVKDFSENRRREILETIHRQTRWLVDIINELLDLARIEARRGKDFNLLSLDLASLVREALLGLSFDRERWPVVCEIDALAAPVLGDAAKLRQAVINIIGNAQKYSPEGGEICIRLLRENERFGIEVADRGLGMTPEQLKNFGERFWRADTSGKVPGTGLGISIVKEIVELHGGAMQVESEFGRGTRVTLWLPAESAGELRQAA